MKALWIRIAARIDALSLRERVLVCAAAIGVVVFLLNELAISPLLARHRALQLELQGQQARVADIDAAITARIGANAADPNVAVIAQIAELKKQTGTLQDSLRAVQHGLVPPEKMAALLQQLMRSSAGLRTVAVRTLPVSGLSTLGVAAPTGSLPHAASTATSAMAGQAADAPKARELLYRHGVELVVQGGYLDMLAYLEALERLPSQLFWGKVELAADNYPNATLTLTVYTLSLDEKWMTL